MEVPVALAEPEAYLDFGIGQLYDTRIIEDRMRVPPAGAIAFDRLPHGKDANVGSRPRSEDVVGDPTGATQARASRRRHQEHEATMPRVRVEACREL